MERSKLSLTVHINIVEILHSFEMLRTALHYAHCLYGEGEMVKCLLELGASQSVLDVVRSFLPVQDVANF